MIVLRNYSEQRRCVGYLRERGKTKKQVAKLFEIAIRHWSAKWGTELFSVGSWQLWRQPQKAVVNG